MTLAEFLLARIAEDEALAKRAVRLPQLPGTPGVGGWLMHIAPSGEPTIIGMDGTRVLAECEAKRTIVEWEQRSLDLERITDSSHSPILIFLALPYADHPDYREEWRP